MGFEAIRPAADDTSRLALYDGCGMSQIHHKRNYRCLSGA
jgi:hypothetical protein